MSKPHHASKFALLADKPCRLRRDSKFRSRSACNKRGLAHKPGHRPFGSKLFHSDPKQLLAPSCSKSCNRFLLGTNRHRVRRLKWGNSCSWPHHSILLQRRELPPTARTIRTRRPMPCVSSQTPLTTSRCTILEAVRPNGMCLTVRWESSFELSNHNWLSNDDKAAIPPPVPFV